LSGSLPSTKDQPSEPVPTPAGPEKDAGDWSSSWGGESLPSQTDDESPAQPGTLPDWLSGLSKEGDSQQQQPAAPSESTAGDWVTSTDRGVVSESESEPVVEFPVTPVVPEIPVETPQEQPSDVIAIPGLETELPAWLKDQADQPDSDNITIDPIKTDMPEWLSSRADQPVEPGEPDEVLQGPTTPDWLSSIPATSSLDENQAKDDEAQDRLIIPSEASAPVPDWSQTIEPVQSLPALPQAEDQSIPDRPAMDDGTATPFMDNKLPDWLENLRPPEEIATPVDESSRPSHEQEANLTPGELPGWVQAMRPVESATPMQPVPPEGDQHMENIGPLAGIQGVLHAENILAGARRPQVYSAKLQVSDKQHTNAALLESMLSQATEPQQVKVEPARLSPRLLTAIVGLVLLLAVWLPIGFNSQQMSLPAFVPAENLSLSVAIEQLPENSPVLVAVEYDSGMVGEMEAVASSAIAHLMAKSANMVLLSTNPMGQVLAERLVAQALTIRPEYPAAEKTANLGYLAGGAPALFDFVVDPNTMTRLLSGTTHGWTGELLAGPHALWNFAQVLVITDNADVARIWIEQVQPQLGGKPMFIIASAQAAPMTSPYVDSGQIKGLVTGLVGGSIYEQLIGKPAFSRYYWDSYQAGLLFLIALIALGGMLGFGSAVSNRQNNGV
jgi:hypothetical protein